MMRQLRSNVLTREQRVDRLRAKLPDGAVERMTEMAKSAEAAVLAGEATDLVIGTTGMTKDYFEGKPTPEVYEIVNAKLGEVSGEMQRKLASGDFNVGELTKKLEKLNEAKGKLESAQMLEADVATLKRKNVIDELESFASRVEGLGDQVRE